MRSLIAAILALVLPMTECAGFGTGEEAPAGTTPTSVPAGQPGGGQEFASTLRNFEDCDGLLAHIRAEALSRVGPYGLDGDQFGPVFGGRAEPAAEVDFAAADSDSAPLVRISGIIARAIRLTATCRMPR